MHLFVKRMVIIFGILLSLFILPAPCKAGEIAVQLVWKFGQAGWVEVKINEGQYVLQMASQTKELGPGSLLQFGWGGLAPVWRVDQEPFQIAAPEGFQLKGKGVFSVQTPEGAQGSYRGKLTLDWTGDRWRLTNTLDKESYLKGVVPIEMSNSWAQVGLEALKAQAVAARTYMEKRLQESKILTDSPDIDQAYLGLSVEGPASSAVEATRTEILADARTRQPISAFYSSNDGGYTEDAQNVWGNHDPHYVAKPDPFSFGVGGATGNWYFLISARELGRTFNLKAINKIELDKLPSGRVKNVKMSDSAGKVLTVTGKALVKKFYPFGKPIQRDAFLGTLFSVENYPLKDSSLATANPVWLKPIGENPFLILPGPRLSKVVSSNVGLLPYVQPEGVFLFQGRGWGHGVGMSQWGAYHMAQMGYSYKDILSFYYENTIVVKTT